MKPLEVSRLRRGRLIVLFDPACRFCRASLRLLRRLDWLRALESPGFHGDYRLGDGSLLRVAELRQQLHVVTPQGTVHRGFDACRAIARVEPPLWPLLPLLHLPGASRIGGRAYGWVAEHRVWLSKVLGLDETPSVN